MKGFLPPAPLGLGIVANGKRQATDETLSDPPEDEEEDQDPAENLNASQESRKRTATDEPVYDQEQDREEQDGEEEDGEEEDGEEANAQECRRSKRIGQKSRKSEGFKQGSCKSKRLRTNKTRPSSVQETQEDEQATTSPNTKSIVLLRNGSETWATIRKMDTMPLNKSVAIHLEKFLEREPAVFLNDTGSLLLIRPKAPGIRSVQEGFASILLYHNQMEHRSILDRVRTLFVWLFFGDLAATLYGENCLITKVKAREIVNALEIETNLIEQIPSIHTKGKPLTHLCNRFGTGSLFFLAEHLTSHL